MTIKKIKVAIVGASGYTGSELARFLIHHPAVEIAMITSERHAGKPFSSLHPQFLGQLDLPLSSAKEIPSANLDIVFLALPHGVSMQYVQQWKDLSFKMIDLSGDFRLRSPEVYKEWYNKEHSFPEGFEAAVYGLPELHAEAIKGSKLIANPGCYPTTAILALAPLFAAGWVIPASVVIDAKSGITGAGIKATDTSHFSNVNENFKAYGLKSHRHTIEIEEQLGQLGKEALKLQFTPHLLPVDRGILATAYAVPKTTITKETLVELYKDFYKNKPFIRLRQDLPSIKDVRASNYCDIHVDYDARTNRIIVISVLDNLTKGAASQAVQNMNLMSGLSEETGLLFNPIKP